MYWYTSSGSIRTPWSNSLPETRKKAMKHQDSLPYYTDILIYDSELARTPVGKVYKVGETHYWATKSGVYVLKANGKRAIKRAMR